MGLARLASLAGVAVLAVTAVVGGLWVATNSTESASAEGLATRAAGVIPLSSRHRVGEDEPVYAPDLPGFTSALGARRDRFVACTRAYETMTGADPFEIEGAVVVEVTAAPGSKQRADVGVQVVTGPADARFDACVAEAIADVAFRSPAAEQRFAWPIPRGE